PFSSFLFKTLTASYISQFWSDFSITKLFFVFADYISPIQINLINTPLHISSFLFKNGIFNWGYFIFAIIPLFIVFIGIINSIVKKNIKVILLLLIGLATLVVMIIASLMGKMVLITKYTMEIYPIFIVLTVYGLCVLKPDFLRKSLLYTLFGIIAIYLLVSDYAPQKLSRPEGHKLVANLINDAKLNQNDKILLIYYDADRFNKYIPMDKFFVETITKYNFQYRLMHNPPSHIQVIKNGKDMFLQTFQQGNNEFFNFYLKNMFFNKMKKGDKFALISINSVAFINEYRMQTVVSDKTFYKRMPFLFLIFSHVVNNTKKEANIYLTPVFEEKQGKWEIFVWEKQ
ncbi:hypothetical protein IJG14_06670, partial [bacterium]|nr:hypothetical protein [bacterium]